MSGVRKYALLNISADESLDTRGGYFKDREPLSMQSVKVHVANMKTDWRVALDERSLCDWAVDAPTSRRAWVCEECHLSIGVLYISRSMKPFGNAALLGPHSPVKLILPRHR